MISLDTLCSKADLMSEPDPALSGGAASLIVRPAVTEAIRDAGDARLSAGHVSAAARRAVAAWASAVAGDGAALAAMASADVAHRLLHPVRKTWQVAPGPAVTEIDVWALNAGAAPPVLKVSFRFTGRLMPGAPGQDAPVPAEDQSAVRDFVGMLTLRLAENAGSELATGHVQTLDEFLGYVFTSRRETRQEYLERAGPVPPAPAGGDGRAFRITAGFAEHDARFGASVSVYVRQGAAPSREEAVRLVWPAVERETAGALGEGDWQPSLNWLELLELWPDTREALSE